jgi:integrase
VQKKLDQARRNIQEGVTLGTSNQTVEQYLLSWLGDVRHRMKPTTHRRYESQVCINILPVIGKIPLAKLSLQHLQSLYSRKLADGLATGTVRHLHAVLKSAFADAVRLSLIARNPADKARPPRHVRHEMQILDERQAALFIEAAHSEPDGVLYVLAITTGMRIGEVTALRWKDVDLDAGTLHVRQNLASISGKLIFIEPKTKNSRRTIRLTKGALDALKKQRVVHEQNVLQRDPDWNQLDLVFPNTVGKPMDPHDLVVRRFRQFLQRAGLPRIRFHDLRHTTATLMLKRGVNVKVVSEILGHSSIGITLGIYGHVLPDMQQSAVDIMNGLFG